MSSITMKLFPIAFNLSLPIDVEKLTVKRKGRVIKGETDANIAAAMKERNKIRNARKAFRRSLAK